MTKSIHDYTAIEILAEIKSRRLSVLDIAKHYLQRIQKYNPVLNAYLSINQNLLEEAQNADDQIQRGSDKPLLGLLIAVKDNFLTKGLPTTASSLVLKDYYPPFESTVTQKLLDAGAIIIGKTNMDAWAHGSSTETSQYGPTKNPHDLDRLPGGSSGGSAAVIAARLAPITIGSETAGSIRQPSAWCGVTGFKPSYGRVSRYGIISMASSTDQAGPITRDVADAALIMNIISGKDKYDATSLPSPVDDYLSLLNKKDLKGIKVGLVKEYLLAQMRPDVKELIHNASKKLVELGAIVEEVSLIDPKYAIGVYTVVQRSEVSSNLARFDGVRYGTDRSFFGPEAKRRIMLGTFTLSAGYYDAYYKKAQAVRTKIISEFDEIFKKYDVVIGAVSPGPAMKIGATLDQPMFGEMEDILTEPAAVAGLTSISIPCGFVDNLPIGLQITGSQLSESKVLSIAKVYQDATNFIKYPEHFNS